MNNLRVHMSREHYMNFQLGRKSKSASGHFLSHYGSTSTLYVISFIWDSFFTSGYFFSSLCYGRYLKSRKEKKKGVPTVAQQDWKHLHSVSKQVRSSAQHSGLRIWRCHSHSVGHNCGSAVILGPGTLCAMRAN